MSFRQSRGVAKQAFRDAQAVPKRTPAALETAPPVVTLSLMPLAALLVIALFGIWIMLSLLATIDPGVIGWIEQLL